MVFYLWAWSLLRRIHVYLVPPALTTSHLENLQCSLHTLTSKSLRSEVLRSGIVFTLSMWGVEGLGFRMQGLGFRFRIQLFKGRDVGFGFEFQV